MNRDYDIIGMSLDNSVQWGGAIQIGPENGQLIPTIRALNSHCVGVLIYPKNILIKTESDYGEEFNRIN